MSISNDARHYNDTETGYKTPGTTAIFGMHIATIIVKNISLIAFGCIAFYITFAYNMDSVDVCEKVSLRKSDGEILCLGAEEAQQFCGMERRKLEVTKDDMNIMECGDCLDNFTLSKADEKCKCEGQTLEEKTGNLNRWKCLTKVTVEEYCKKLKRKFGVITLSPYIGECTSCLNGYKEYPMTEVCESPSIVDCFTKNRQAAGNNEQCGACLDGFMDKPNQENCECDKTVFIDNVIKKCMERDDIKKKCDAEYKEVVTIPTGQKCGKCLDGFNVDAQGNCMCDQTVFYDGIKILCVIEAHIEETCHSRHLPVVVDNKNGSKKCGDVCYPGFNKEGGKCTCKNKTVFEDDMGQQCLDDAEIERICSAQHKNQISPNSGNGATKCGICINGYKSDNNGNCVCNDVTFNDGQHVLCIKKDGIVDICHGKHLTVVIDSKTGQPKCGDSCLHGFEKDPQGKCVCNNYTLKIGIDVFCIDEGDTNNVCSAHYLPVVIDKNTNKPVCGDTCIRGFEKNAEGYCECKDKIVFVNETVHKCILDKEVERICLDLHRVVEQLKDTVKRCGSCNNGFESDNKGNCECKKTKFEENSSFSCKDEKDITKLCSDRHSLLETDKMTGVKKCDKCLPGYTKDNKAQCVKSTTGTGSKNRSSKTNTGLIVGVVLGVAAFIFIVALIGYFAVKKTSNRSAREKMTKVMDADECVEVDGEAVVDNNNTNINYVFENR